MKEVKLTVAGVPITAVYDEPMATGNSYNHESGAVLEFSTAMVKVYKLSWNSKTEIVGLTTKNDDESLIELAWQCFFKALAVQRPEESSSYEILSKDMYACSFCNTWTQIKENLTGPAEEIYHYEDDDEELIEDNNCGWPAEEDFMGEEDEADWDWYDEYDEWR